MARTNGSQADPLRDASRGVRLQKALAEAGVGSRRRCEELIESGAVAVNDRVVDTLPAWVDPQRDRLTVDGAPVRGAERRVYVMLNKPRRTVTSLDDPEGRRDIADLVDHPASARLFPVGRLDYDTTGLLLLTNDGELANRLTHPRYGVDKTYRAVVKGCLDDDALATLRRGVYLARRRQGRTVGAERAAPADVRLVRRERDRTILDITLTEGRNRQVRRMLAHLDRPVRKLKRIRMGPLNLKGLRTGEWRELTRDELRELRRVAGRAAAGAKRNSA